MGSKLWNLINSDSDRPDYNLEVTATDLNQFIMLTFADLKKYTYYYWCGFPALLQKPGWETAPSGTGTDLEEWPAIDDNIVSLLIARRRPSFSEYTRLSC